MTEKLELCKFIFKNSNFTMKFLSKKSTGWLRSMKARIEADQRQQKFNKMMGHK